ncbi:DUF2093 domain-containing protein [Caulobacter sp. S45]|uniref:DUF2093 domain-containing protein n=1 Tax=Caulobacter sp. S45 TaxID=1641861 RepID=UPI0015755DC8|nr:DUF2093 domain-containing protein [Caulobacter sp. S45]
MNALDRDMAGAALLHYGDGEYTVLKPGAYVACAMSGQRLPLDSLRYWSVERQEPYAGAREALQRMVVPMRPS